jgi:hypothetical protein
MNILERLLGVRSDAPAPAPASDDFVARLDAMNSNAANAKTPEQAFAVMRESVGITTDLVKSLSKSGAPAEKAEEETPAAKNEDDEETPAPTSEAPEPVADTADEPTSDNPDDADLMADAPPSDAPAATPEAIAAASGKEGETAPEEDKTPLNKSVSEVMADHVPTGEEPLVDASLLVDELLKSIGASQVREAQNADALETIMEYQVQLGTLLTKSMEGQKIIFEQQKALDERMARIESGQTQSQESTAQQVEDLKKSFTGALEGVGQYVQGIQRQPQGTPSGHAPLAANSLPHMALTDAVPTAEPTHNGWTRGELRKSIEGHIRSDRCTTSGVTTQHFLSINRAENLAELDPLIFEVANAERALITKR